MTHKEMLAALNRAVGALGPYRSNCVLAGGFVPLVYREAEVFGEASTPALLSGDIDLVVPEALEKRDRTLRAYLDDANFTVVMSRSTKPPVHYFQPEEFGSESLAPFHMEFLAPLKGSETSSDGSSRSPREIQTGINAQLLRYLDLLLFEPLEVELFDPPLLLRVPNPCSFVVQKLLSSRLRANPEKADKDSAWSRARSSSFSRRLN